MESQKSRIGDILSSILRGAAKILGCNSAHLIIFNEQSRDVRIHIGINEMKTPLLWEMEEVIGSAFEEMTLNMDEVQDSLVFKSWKERSVKEASSLSELMGSLFPEEISSQITSMVLDHRFICVPTFSGPRLYGVLVFEKENPLSFSPQQRELMLRYAHRLGEILDNDLRDIGISLTAQGTQVYSPGENINILMDENGKVVGGLEQFRLFKESLDAQGVAGSGLELDNFLDALVGELGETARQKIRSENSGRETRELTIPGISIKSESPKIIAELSLIDVERSPFLLCSLQIPKSRSEQTVQNQLLQMALGETVPSILVDPEYRITSCNESTERVLGYSHKELIGSNIHFLFQDRDDIQAILNHQFLFLSDGYYEDVTVLRHRSGEPLPGKIEALLLAGESDEVIGYLVLVRVRPKDDDRGENRPENAMKQERLATMGQMAAQLAHEIRNPLLAIGATLELLSTEDGQNQENQDILVTLAKEITRMDMILKDYLSLAARQNLSITKVDIGQVLTEAQTVISGTGKSERKKIVVDCDNDLVVLADHNGLKHVFFNLLQNALEASPQGGTVSCSIKSHNDHVLIAIDDEGAGIKCEPGECFSPFFTTKKNGTGLGLTVCRKIIEVHGGTIEISNRSEGGSRVTISIPRRVSK